MLKGVLIRRGEVSDFDNLARLVEEPTVGFDIDTLRSKPEIFTYVAEDERIFGFVMAGGNELLGEEVGELLGLYIAPSHRRNGMGKKLMVRGLNLLKRLNFDRGVMFVSEPSTEAREILRTVGFVENGEVRELNLQGEVITQMGYEVDLSPYF